MTPDEPTPCPESTPRDDGPGLYDAPDREPIEHDGGTGDGHACIDLSDTGDAGADEAGWQIDEPLDDDRYDGRYDECHDDGRYDDEWGDHRWDRFDGYESLHQRHAPHDWPVFDQPTEPPADEEVEDPLDAAEREAEAAEPDAFRWFRQERDESA